MFRKFKSSIQWLWIIQFCIILFFFDAQVQAQKASVIIGRVISASTKQPVSYTFILNRSRKTSLSCDTSGYFRISASREDTLIVSRIGFYQKMVVVSDSILRLHKILTIGLFEKAYDLKTVNIIGLGTYQQFKRQIVTMKLPVDSFQINPAITKAFKQKVVILQPQMAIPIMSPVTLLYNAFSKEGKSLRKLAKENEKDHQVQSYKGKYSPEIVSQLTGLKELELEKFMKYCNLDINFISSSNEYDIAERVLILYKQYCEEKEHPKDNP
jgi:hypothetical protein